MKYILGIYLILISLSASSQSTYMGGTTSLNLTDTTNELGQKLKRKAVYKAMIYNFGTNSINIQCDIFLYDSSGNTKLTRWITPVVKNFDITNAEYVKAQNGQLIGNSQQLHEQYGVVKTPATDSTPVVYHKSKAPGGLDSMSIPCIGRYDYYLTLFDLSALNNRLHQDIIKSLMAKAYVEGKLN